MNDQYHSERDLTDPIQLSQDSVQSYQLSQDSVHSNLSQDFTSELLDCENVNEPDKKVKKKKSGTIKKVKKKKKTESLDEETEDGSERPKKKKKKGKISKRPEPEGGNAQPHILNPMSEFDRVIYSNEPLFSDLEVSDNELLEVPDRPVRTPRPGGAMIPCLQLGMHSNTMIKFAIIGSEIQNLLRVSLIRHEQEIQSLTRKISLLEEDIMKAEERFTTASGKLEEASKAADESERNRKVLENLNSGNDERIDQLEKQLTEAKWIAEEADKKYEEAARKLAITEVDLERAEARLEAAEAKVIDLEEQLTVVGANIKTLQVQNDQASQREDSYEETIRDLTNRLKDAENRATEAERTVSKLQKEVDRLEDELLTEKERYKAISDELDATFAELAGY